MILTGHEPNLVSRAVSRPSLGAVPFSARPSRSECKQVPVGAVIVQQVRVDVGDAQTGMPEGSLDGHRRDAPRERERRERVPAVVNGQRSGPVGPEYPAGHLEPRPGVLAVERLAQRPGRQRADERVRRALRRLAISARTRM